MGKVIRDWQQLVKDVESRRAGKKVVFTNGCFDILHLGHVRYLQAAREQGDLLVIGLNTDASVRKLKGPDRPVQNEEDRAEILAALACVDYVTFFPQETPLELIEAVKPDVLVKGGDYKAEDIVGYSFVKGRGGEVHTLSFVPGRSTSSIIDKINRS